MRYVLLALLLATAAIAQVSLRIFQQPSDTEITNGGTISNMVTLTAEFGPNAIFPPTPVSNIMVILRR